MGNVHAARYYTNAMRTVAPSTEIYSHLCFLRYCDNDNPLDYMFKGILTEIVVYNPSSNELFVFIMKCFPEMGTQKNKNDPRICQ